MTAAVYWYICAKSTQIPTIPAATRDQAEFNRRIAGAAVTLAAERSRVGDLIARPLVRPVPNHLLCDGSAVSRVGFPQLFAEIGTEWGPGDGSTTFNIPDLVGAAIPFPASAPAQTIGAGTSSTGETITEPSGAGETGGSVGGNVPTGGRTQLE